MLCPICKKPVSEPDAIPTGTGASSSFPFCSERCKLIDLGRWLDGKYQIAIEAPNDDEEPTSDSEGS